MTFKDWDIKITSKTVGHGMVDEIVEFEKNGIQLRYYNEMQWSTIDEQSDKIKKYIEENEL